MSNKKRADLQFVERNIWQAGDGSYWVRVNLKVGQASRAVHGSLEEARDARGQLIAELARRPLPLAAAADGSLTIRCFGQCLEVYRDSVQPLKGTKRKWKGRDGVYNRLRAELGRAPLDATLWDKLTLFKGELERTYTSREKPMAPATRNRHIEMAKAAVRCCYVPKLNRFGRRLIDRNWLEEFPIELEHNERRIYLSPADKRKLFEYLPEYGRAMTYFALRRPMRIGELIGLRVSQVDLFHREITLRSDETKAAYGRFIPIPDESLAYFTWVVSSGSEWAFCREVKGEFRQLVYDTWVKDFRASASAAGLSPLFTFHRLRGQSAIEMILDGWEWHEVQRIAGWKSEAAMRRYVDIDQLMIWKRREIHKQDVQWKTELAPAGNQ